MSFKHIIKPFLAVAAASALILVSCTETDDINDAVGYLSCPILDVDLTVDNLVGTKAVALPDVPDPNLSEIKFVIKQDDKVIETVDEPWTEPKVMRVGQYKIEAIVGQKNAFGAPYYSSGEVPVEITALNKSTLEMTLSVANSLVYIELSPDLAKHFTYMSSTLNDYPALCNEWIYVPSGVAMTLHLTGNSSANVATTLDFPLGQSEARKAYHVVCDLKTEGFPAISLPDQQAGAWATRLYINPATVSGNISEANKAKMVYEVSASEDDWSNPSVAEKIEGDYYVVKGLKNDSQYYVRASIGQLTSNIVGPITVNDNLPGTTVTLAHNNASDPNVVLSCTNSTLDLNLTGILKTLYDANLLNVSAELKRGNDIVRTSSSSAGVMDGEVSTWPYLPQGTDAYSLTVSHKLSTESSYVTSSAINGFDSPAPEFIVKLGKSYSSYDYGVGNPDNGISKDAVFANKLTGEKSETIFDVGITSWGISEELISNTKYSYIRTVEFKLDGVDKTAPAVGSTTTFTNLSWDSHVISAKTTFDGFTSSDSRTHYITGLPYSHDFHATQTIPGNWIAKNIKWESTSQTTKLVICYNGSDGYLISPKFNFTGTVEYNVEAQYYSTWGSTIKLYVGATSTNNSTASTYDSYDIDSNNKLGENHISCSKTLNISSTGYPYVSIYHNKHNSSASPWDYLCVYEFHLKYK